MVHIESRFHLGSDCNINLLIVIFLSTFYFYSITMWLYAEDILLSYGRNITKKKKQSTTNHKNIISACNVNYMYMCVQVYVHVV